MDLHLHRGIRTHHKHTPPGRIRHRHMVCRFYNYSQIRCSPKHIRFNPNKAMERNHNVVTLNVSIWPVIPPLYSSIART